MSRVLTDEEKAVFKSLLDEEERTGVRVTPNPILSLFPGRSYTFVQNHLRMSRHRRKGLCMCGRERDSHHKLCSRCQKGRDQHKAERKREGLCLRCGKPLGRKASATTCHTCARRIRPKTVRKGVPLPKKVGGGSLCLFPWIRTRSGKKVVENLPGGRPVVDLFAGSASLSLRARKRRREVLCINDRHPLLMTFFTSCTETCPTSGS